MARRPSREAYRVARRLNQHQDTMDADLETHRANARRGSVLAFLADIGLDDDEDIEDVRAADEAQQARAQKGRWVQAAASLSAVATLKSAGRRMSMGAGLFGRGSRRFDVNGNRAANQEEDDEDSTGADEDPVALPASKRPIPAGMAPLAIPSGRTSFFGRATNRASSRASFFGGGGKGKVPNLALKIPTVKSSYGGGTPRGESSGSSNGQRTQRGGQTTARGGQTTARGGQATARGGQATARGGQTTARGGQKSQRGNTSLAGASNKAMLEAHQQKLAAGEGTWRKVDNEKTKNSSEPRVLATINRTKSMRI